MLIAFLLLSVGLREVIFCFMFIYLCCLFNNAVKN